MPRHPARDPSPSFFGPLPILASLPTDALQSGVAPWATVDESTGFAVQKDVSDVPLRQGCSPLVFGGGVFGQGMYNDDDFAQTELPIRLVRLALRYGINAIDTSPYYYPSEFILGRCLSLLAEEHPRSTYYLGTKAGRYGPSPSEFDYSPATIRSSVEASLRRLGTQYLDLVYLHDVEFIAEQVGDGQKEGMTALLASQDDEEGAATRKSLGLAAGEEHIIHGPGDETILAAVATLFELKDEGKIRNVGISGYPLPTLLRLSRLVASRPPHRSLDAVLSYSNHTLHSDILPAYQRLFHQAPTTIYTSNEQIEEVGETSQYKAPLVLNGSPFSMGLLTDTGPPAWHPAPERLKKACRDAAEELKSQACSGDQKRNLAVTALRFGIRGAEVKAEDEEEPALRTLLGMSTPDQVHSAIDAYRVLLAGVDTANGGGPSAYVNGIAQSAEERERLFQLYQEQVQNEKIVHSHIVAAGKSGWSWASPGEE